MKFQILLYDGFDALDAVGPAEVLRMAAKAGADFEVEFVTLEGRRPVDSAYGTTLLATEKLSARHEAVVIVPGGGWIDRSKHMHQGAYMEFKKGIIPAALVHHYNQGAIIATVCTGAMLAGELLKGRRAVTHQGALEDLRQAGANIVNARVVDDGDLLTSGGITSGIDLGLHLVARFASKELAEDLSRRLEWMGEPVA